MLINSNELAPREGVVCSFWLDVLNLVKKRVPEQSFLVWLEPIKFIGIRNGVLSLEVPDRFYGDWIKQHYDSIIRDVVFELTGSKVEICFAPSNHPNSQVITNSSRASAVQTIKNLDINNRYTFDNFVIGPGNRFAHAAALAVSDAPARSYNPLFIYGRVGLGKTHLMQAVAHRVLERNPQTKILYLSGEKFTNQLISAIQNRSTEGFRKKYRWADFLLVDDVHFIAGKEATQEEFFHTFNHLYDAHKQIIVSSDRPPKEITGLEERLISRFAWGLVADVQPPDFETRVAILKKKMAREAALVPEEVIYFIANKIKSNIRELEGALIRVVAYSQLTGNVVDVKVVENEVLRDAVLEEVGNITVDKIQKVICDYFKLKLSDLCGKNRSKSVVLPRQVGMYLTRKMTDLSLPEIGNHFGGRGHATVIHSCNKIENTLTKGGRAQILVEDIKLLIQKG